MQPSLRAEDLLEHRDFLRALARSILRDADRAEDVVQDAFVAALEQRSAARAGLRAWLATVVRNRSLNQGRGDRRRSERERLAAKDETSPSHEDVAQRLEQSQLLLGLVQALPEKHRTAIYLRFYEGKTPAAIASQLGLSVETVKTHLRRALAELRLSLDRRNDGDRGAWMSAIAPLACWTSDSAVIALTAKSSFLTPIAVAVKAGLAMKKLTLVIVAVLALFGTLQLLGEGGSKVYPVNEVSLGPPRGESVATAPQGEGTSTDISQASVAGQREAADTPQAIPGALHEVQTGSLTVSVLWESSAEAAEGIGVIAMPAEDSAGLEIQRAKSDSAGRVTFEGLPLGLVHLEGFRGGKAQAEITEGAASKATLRIPPGLEVKGSVVDVDGYPVAGAEVWLQRDHRPGALTGQLATHTDDLGRFQLHSVDPSHGLAARAKGHAPSVTDKLNTRDTTGDHPVEITLRLRSGGGSLKGMVVDGERQPIPNAVVCVGESDRYAMRSDGSSYYVAPPQVVRTDESGRFCVDGVEAGFRMVFAQARGFAQSAIFTEVTAHESASVTIRLGRGFFVEGVVSDNRGVPLAGALIQSLPQVRTGQPQLHHSFDPQQARSTADGRYRLGPLQAGTRALIATSSGESEGKARSRVTGEAGETLAWNPRLEGPYLILGQLRDVDGRSLSQWTIHAFDAGGEWLTSVETDATGEFSLTLPTAGPFSIGAARYRFATRENCEVLEEGVLAHSDELILRLTNALPAGATLLGRFVDRGGRVESGARLRLQLDSKSSMQADEDLNEGPFRIGPLAPGTYSLRIMSGTSTILSRGSIVLSAGEELDLGELNTEASGSLVVAVTTQSGLDVPLERADIVAVEVERRDFQRLILQDGRFVAHEITQGDWRIISIQDGCFSSQVLVQVHAGEEAQASVHLEIGVLRSFSLKTPDTEESWSELRLSMHDPSGALLYELTAPAFPGAAEFPIGMMFPLGKTNLSFFTDTGLTAAYTLDIKSTDDEQTPPVVIELR